MSTSPRGGESPGLVADAVYLRPAQRAEAVIGMIELGMFVREFPTHVGAPRDAAAELAVVFAGDDEGHLRTVQRIVQAGRVVLAVLPDAGASEGFTNAGALRVLVDGDGPCTLRSALAEAGQVVRQRRAQNHASNRVSVFGGLQFGPGEPLLTSATSLAGLSPIEHEVLRVLAATRGSLVTKERLRQHLSSSSEPATDGYLKTVILRIRRKVATLGGDPTHLATVRGAGYMLR